MVDQLGRGGGADFSQLPSPDRSRAKTVADALESQGWSVWWDRKIPAGQRFDEVISNELDASACAVVLWSSSSVKSDWVKEEAREAAARKALVPVLLDDVAIPLGFRSIQAARLVGWNGAVDAQEFLQLRDSVALSLERSRQASERRPESREADVGHAAARSPEPDRSDSFLRSAIRSRSKTTGIVAGLAVAISAVVAISIAFIDAENGDDSGPVSSQLNVAEIESRLKDANIEISTGSDADKARVRSYFTDAGAAYHLLAISCLQVLGNSRLRETNYLDMIDKWYTLSVGSQNYVGPDGRLDHESLKKAIVKANNEYHGQSITSFDALLVSKK